MLNLSILGASGRMGKELLNLIAQDPNFNLTQAVTSKNNPHLGKDSGTTLLNQANHVPFTSELDTHTDCLIDFSTGDSHENYLDWACEHNIPFVIGTTALKPSFEAKLRQASKQIPILCDCNFSTGIALMRNLAEEASRCLPQDFDVEIIEKHHRYKKDTPSGAALSLARIVQDNSSSTKELQVGRSSKDYRQSNKEIGIHSIRGGNIFGEHSLLFISEMEKIELSHQALSRSCFAKGALHAASFLLTQSPSLYCMRDSLKAVMPTIKLGTS
ncbi:MAG: 4-hydroxy-tetrahydrodipicolinate reductase [Chlamydiales bacterium]|nr:4-hydroxy-tetrahydrodipicolinate reductase [Chlamydiales bacterium]